MISHSERKRHVCANRPDGNCLVVSLFRSLQLRWCSQPLPLPTRRHPHRLLALLLLECNGTLRERDEIACQLWPGDELSLTRPRLRLCLHGLSDCLPPLRDEDPWIVRDGTRLGWRLDSPCDVDAWSLDRAEQELRRPVDGTPTAHRLRIAQLQAALAMYSGPLLPILEDAWLGEHRAHYETAYRRISIALFEHLVTIGDRNEALKTARRLVLHDSSDESAHMRLIQFYMDDGDRESAIRQFEICFREFQFLGVAPSHEMESLVTDIRAGKQIASTVRDGQAVALHPSTEPPGDDGVYVDAQQRTRGLASTLNSSRLVGVIGPCGAGKSRVVRETARMQFPLWKASGISLFWYDSDGFETVHDIGTTSHPCEAICNLLIDSLSLSIGLPIATSSRTNLARIVERIGQSAVMLILDNVDLHVEAWTILVERLLACCRRLRIVYTACTPMRVPGEFIWRIPLLSTCAPALAAAGQGTSAYSSLGLVVPGASSEAIQLYGAMGGRLPIPLPDRQPVAKVIDTWIAEADGLPLAAILLAKLSRGTASVPPDLALHSALWSTSEAEECGSRTGQSAVRAVLGCGNPHVGGSITPARHASLVTAYAHTLVHLSQNAHLLLSILHKIPVPLSPRTVQSAYQLHSIATHPEDAKTGIYADVFDKANASLPISGDWIDGLIELEEASVISVNMREGQSTVYRIREGIRRYVDLLAALT